MLRVFRDAGDELHSPPGDGVADVTLDRDPVW